MIQNVPINTVKANPNNPRIIKDDKFAKLVKSINEFPQMLNLRPIVVNDDMIVLGGNMRLKACKEAGLKDIPIIKASELTEQQQKEFIVKDNVGYGEWDWNDLANNWDSEQLIDWGLDIPGFKIEEEKEMEDLSDKLKSEFKIEIICRDEAEQEQTYNKLIEQNYECRLLTL
jgi:ParB-like chromosome segregation protein Spo0J